MARRGKVLGAQSLRRKLKRMPQHVKGGVQEAIRDSVDVVYTEALARVPVKEGYLAAALGKRISSDKLGGRVGYWERGNRRKWKLGGWRAHFIEFGTRGGKGTAAHPAQPFLGPALNASRHWVKRRIRRAIDKALKRAIHERL